jgi:hypothetical protein
VCLLPQEAITASHGATHSQARLGGWAVAGACTAAAATDSRPPRAAAGRRYPAATLVPRPMPPAGGSKKKAFICGINYL